MSKAVANAAAKPLPSLVKEAAAALSRATSAAEVLDAHDQAGVVYDMAKRTARLQKAKAAHDELVGATYRVQADALEIESLAKRRLADEYDAAQERGEVAKRGKPVNVPERNNKATSAELGIGRKDIHEARQMRAAIVRDPAIVREALDDILASGDEPTRAALKRAIAPAVKTLRGEEQAAKKERRAHREIELAASQAALPVKKYGVIYADPEWQFDPYSLDSGMDRAADNHYPTSDLLPLMRRDVGAIAAKDCVLFMWATVPMLVEAICVLDAWGFAWIERDPNTGFLAPNKAHARYVSSWAWLKNRIATGYWNRGKHELLLIATRGKPVAPAMGDQLDSWCEDMAVMADVGRHSAKPPVFAEWIEKHWPNTPKIELNARDVRPGWDAWGNEAGEAATISPLEGEMSAKPTEGVAGHEALAPSGPQPVEPTPSGLPVLRSSCAAAAEGGPAISPSRGEKAKASAPAFDVDPKLIETVAKGMQTATGRKALVKALDVLIEAEEAPKPKRGRPRKAVPA